MMIENQIPGLSEDHTNHSDVSQPTTLKEMVEALDDGEVISIPLEGTVVNNG